MMVGFSFSTLGLIFPRAIGFSPKATICFCEESCAVLAIAFSAPWSGGGGADSVIGGGSGGVVPAVDINRSTAVDEAVVSSLA